jgi:transcriptional regulator with AAA-type ATPase domain
MAVSERSAMLDESTLSYLRQRGTEVEIPQGETILRRGDHGRALFLVLDGEVEVRIEGAENRCLPLCRMGRGAIFGELSILRDCPVSADVVAATDARLLRYPAEAVPDALVECEALRREMLSSLARNLGRATTDAWGLFNRAETFASLAREGEGGRELLAFSARMRGVRKQLEQAGAVDTPVLVVGAPGTGRLLAARTVHTASPRPPDQLTVVDCRELDPARAATMLFGASTGGDLLESSGCFGALQLAHGGSLILRHVDALGRDVQQRLAEFFRSAGRGATPCPDTRVIATAASEDAVDVELLAAMGTVVTLPPLAERQRDILPLANQFLHEAVGGDDACLSESAAHTLVSMPFRYRNVAELKDVITTAVRCADGPEIRAEHLLGGLGEERPRLGAEITKRSLIRWLTEAGGVRTLRWLTAAGFAAAVVACLVAADTVVGRTANRAVWAVWEPAVFAMFLAVGSVWCTVCPLSTAARWIQRRLGLQRSPPAWLLRWAPPAAILGFALILWSENVFGMRHTPVATAVMLVALVISAALFAVLFTREVWCRHVCPLGQLAVAFAPASTVAVGAQHNVCASTCTTHECYRGADPIPGCTVFHHPMATRDAHHCKLCLDCLQSCPHGSAGVYLRPPSRGAAGLTGPESYDVGFAVAIPLLALVALAAETTPWLPAWTGFTAACAAAVLVAIVCGAVVRRLVVGGRAAPSALATTACGLAVLGWGALMALQMGHIPALESWRVVAADGGTPDGGLLVVTVARLVMITIAAVLGAWILVRGQRRAPRPRWTWAVVWLVAAAIPVTAVVLSL